ncbi:MAG: hypothetical protein AAF957_05265 [Planctomycetota bacterium]
MQSLSSRPLNELGCPTLHFLTAFLLTDTDLVGLGIWDSEMRQGLTPTAWCRSHLHVAVQCNEHAARTVTDLLDLRYVDQILAVRSAGIDALSVAAADAVADPGHARGLLWALLTDPRDKAHALGTQLMTEVFVRGIRDYGSAPYNSPRPRTNS